MIPETLEPFCIWTSSEFVHAKLDEIFKKSLNLDDPLNLAVVLSYVLLGIIPSLSRFETDK